MIFSETKPIYMQIADRIMDDVAAGIYPADGRLPSVREYAASVEVNANTVMRTYDYLQQQQIIYNKRGIGYFAAADGAERVMAMRRETFFAREADYFMRRLKEFGVTPDDLTKMYTNYLNNQ